MQNLSSLGAILGVVVRDDVAKLAAGSIYSARKRWPVNRAKRAATGKEKGTGASARWLLPWRSLRRSPDAPSMTICDVVKRPDTWRKTERRRFTGVLIGFHRGEHGTVVGVLYLLEFIHDGDPCLIPSAIHSVSTNHGDPIREFVHGGRRRRELSTPVIFPVLYHGICSSVGLTDRVWASFSLRFI
jgi:hypothetical protein